MTEKKTQAEAKASKAVALRKTPVAKAEVKPAAPAAKAPKAASAGGKVTVMQVGSPIGRQGYQRATLIGLGLNKLNRQRTLEDTPSIRGMIEKVKHLVKVISGQ